MPLIRTSVMLWPPIGGNEIPRFLGRLQNVHQTQSSISRVDTCGHVLPYKRDPFLLMYEEQFMAQNSTEEVCRHSEGENNVKLCHVPLLHRIRKLSRNVSFKQIPLVRSADILSLTALYKQTTPHSNTRTEEDRPSWQYYLRDMHLVMREAVVTRRESHDYLSPTTRAKAVSVLTCSSRWEDSVQWNLTAHTSNLCTRRKWVDSFTPRQLNLRRREKFPYLPRNQPSSP
jgi:hypothetical protein